MTEVMERADEMQVSYLPVEYVVDIWPKIRGYVTATVKYTYGRYEPEDVLEMLVDGTHMMWMAFQGQEIRGVVISTFQEYPRAKYLSCPFVMGEDFDSWKDPMLATLRKWASENDCDGIESTARIGWARKFKDDGYEAMWQTFQLPLDDPKGMTDG
jgi:hypothetical protein